MREVWFRYKIYFYVSTYIFWVKVKLIGSGHRYPVKKTYDKVNIGVDQLRITYENSGVYNNPGFILIILSHFFVCMFLANSQYTLPTL